MTTSHHAPQRRAGPDRPAAHSRDRHDLRRAGRELPRGTRRALCPAQLDPLRHLPPGRRRRQHGGSLRQAHRQARESASSPAGPGATNASIGLHTGFQDSTPMILLVGQVAREATDREAFQEIDYRRMFGQMAKWVAQIEDARRIPELVSQAFHTALNGRPGPGRAGAARGHADRRGRGGRCRPLQDRPRRAGARRHGEAARAAASRPSGRW